MFLAAFKKVNFRCRLSFVFETPTEKMRLFIEVDSFLVMILQSSSRSDVICNGKKPFFFGLKTIVFFSSNKRTLKSPSISAGSLSYPLM